MRSGCGSSQLPRAGSRDRPPTARAADRGTGPGVGVAVVEAAAVLPPSAGSRARYAGGAAPGRPKTYKLDAVWPAKLTERGMLRPSFVPPAEIRRLCDYTRLRTDLTREPAQYWQRLEKLLKDSLIKVAMRANTGSRPGTAVPLRPTAVSVPLEVLPRSTACRRWSESDSFSKTPKITPAHSHVWASIPLNPMPTKAAKLVRPRETATSSRASVGQRYRSPSWQQSTVRRQSELCQRSWTVPRVVDHAAVAAFWNSVSTSAGVR